MGGKTATTTSSVNIPSEVLNRYKAVNTRAESTASTPFQKYSTDPNAFVAPMNATQQQAIQRISGLGGTAQPWYTAGANMTMQGSGPIAPEAIRRYESPYMESVINPTMQRMQQEFGQQRAALDANAIQAGAFGGDRAGIERAMLRGQQGLSQSQVLGQLYNQNYGQALGAAQQDAARMLSGGQQIAGLGTGLAQTEQQLAQAQLGAGTAQQQTDQAGLQALYNQFLQERSYPFQVSQFLANIAMGTGALSGSTTTTQQPIPFFSDERLKSNIEKIGKTFDGQNIYRYDMGDGRTQMGLLAQEVEEHKPEAVGLAGGYRTVDYRKATEDAARPREEAARGGAQHISPSDLNEILAAQQQAFGPYAQAGLYGGDMRAAPGGGLGGYVPEGRLPVAELAVSQHRPEPIKSGVSQLVETAERGMDLYDSGKKAWDRLGEGYEWAKKKLYDEDEREDRRYRGGLVRYASGGSIPYENEGPDYFNEDLLERETPELEAADAPDSKPRSVAGDIASLAKLFFSRGGAAERQAYETGGGNGLKGDYDNPESSEFIDVPDEYKSGLLRDAFAATGNGSGGNGGLVPVSAERPVSTGELPGTTESPSLSANLRTVEDDERMPSFLSDMPSYKDGEVNYGGRAFWSPVLQGLGAMAKSQSLFAGSAMLEGLGAGAQAYDKIVGQQQELEESKAREFQGRASAVLTASGIPSERIIRTPDGRVLGAYVEQNGQMVFMPVDRLMEMFYGAGAMASTAGAPSPAGTTPPDPATGVSSETEPGQPPMPERDALMSAAERQLQENIRMFSSANPAQVADAAKNIQFNPFTQAAEAASVARAGAIDMAKMAEAASGIDSKAVGYGVLSSITIPVTRYVNDLVDMFNLDPNLKLATDSDLRDAQVLEKIGTLKAAAQAAGAGQQSLQSLELMLTTLPNTQMTRDAAGAIVSSMLVDQKRAIDKDTYLRQVQQMASRNPIVRANQAQNIIGRGMDELFDQYTRNQYANDAKKLERFFLLKGRQSGEEFSLMHRYLTKPDTLSPSVIQRIEKEFGDILPYLQVQ